MSPQVVGLIGIAVMLILLALRMPIGIAMLLVGIVGFGWLNGIPAALAALETPERAAARLGGAGAIVIDADPDDFATKLGDAYLDAKAQLDRIETPDITTSLAQRTSPGACGDLQLAQIRQRLEQEVADSVLGSATE